MRFSKALLLSLTLAGWGCGGTLGRTDGGPDDGGSAELPRRDLRRGDGGAGGDGPLADRGTLQPDGPPIDPGQDTDGDGLPDGFEALFAGFDPNRKDSDGDTIPDGAEDEDQDGLTAEQEWAAWSLGPYEGRKASPLHRDLLVEVDCQQGRCPSSTVIAAAIDAFAAANLPNPDGTTGIALHLYLDEQNLPLVDMTEPIADRLAYLGSHGPKFSVQAKHLAKMVHVIFASARPGSPNRGGDTIASTNESPEKAGVLIYVDNLGAIFPICASPTQPAITVEEGTASTLVHELGHTLQLGHDTAVGGGVNAYNIMSTDLGECELLRQRVRGLGNSDPSLGATDSAGGPRFSQAAADLIKLKNKISVEANKFEVGSGYEM